MRYLVEVVRQTFQTMFANRSELVYGIGCLHELSSVYWVGELAHGVYYEDQLSRIQPLIL